MDPLPYTAPLQIDAVDAAAASLNASLLAPPTLGRLSSARAVQRRIAAVYSPPGHQRLDGQLPPTERGLPEATQFGNWSRRAAAPDRRGDAALDAAVALVVGNRTTSVARVTTSREELHVATKSSNWSRAAPGRHRGDAAVAHAEHPQRRPDAKLPTGKLTTRTTARGTGKSSKTKDAVVVLGVFLLIIILVLACMRVFFS